MKQTLAVLCILALAHNTWAIDLPNDLSANNVAKFTNTQLEIIRENLAQSGLVPTFSNTVDQVQADLLDLIFYPFEGKFESFIFDFRGFRIGMLAGLCGIVFQAAFTSFFPTFSWIPLTYQLRLSSPAMSIFTIFCKMGVEIFHQVDGNNFPNKSFAAQDLAVTIMGAIILALTGDWGYLLGALLLDFIKNTFLYSVL